MFDRFIELAGKYPILIPESFCVLVPFFVGLIRWKHFYVYLKVIWLVFLAYALTDLVIWEKALRRENNYFWINLQEIIIAWLLIISFNFLKENPPKKIVYGLLAISAIAAFFDFNFSEYSSWIKVVHRVMFIGLCFHFFFKLLEELKVSNILRYPAFWINSGLMLMACGTALIFVFEEITISYSSANDTVYEYYTLLNFSLKIIFTLLAAYGFWVSKVSSHE
ncbi:hypothetical protein [Jiulongibacter sp. NS-SX5]|uniref:hypothetical protein n=1 Tax=Jiulongibacter sp. NS-SX5 TaxID=3463854 RepID=UPI0040592146